MCGLIGWLSKNQNVPTERVRTYVVDQFQDQISRGTRGFGLVEIGDDGYTNVLRATSEPKMLLDAYSSKVKHLFLHHRSPTSSENTLDQTHPMEVEHEELSYIWNIMHNGTIHNAETLKKEHEALGYVYLTEHKISYPGYSSQKFNDSEALAIELARFLENKSKEGKPPTMNTKGGFAFMAIATDKKAKVRKIYIGTNGYGGINLADNGQAYYFASEEKAGAAIPKDEIICFDAEYAPALGPDGGEDLIGFKMLKEPIKIEYPIEPIEDKTPVRSPWSKDFQDHERYPRMGFGKHQHSPKVIGEDTVGEDGNDVHFSSYAHIVSYIGRGKLGEIFQDSAKAQHVAIEEFDLKSFNDAIAVGKPDEAEDIYNSFIAGIGEWLGLNEALAETLEPVGSEKIKEGKAPKIEDIIAAAKDVQEKRMRAISRDYLPLFQLCAYCECVITLAYQYQMELTKRETDKKEISAKIDQANPDKLLDEQIQRDVNEVFPDPKKEKDAYAADILARQNTNKDDERVWDNNGVQIAHIYDSASQKTLELPEKIGNISIIKDGKITPEGRQYMAEHPIGKNPEFKEAEYKELPSKIEDLDTDAGAMLSALGETAQESYPEDIYRNAEEVGEAIRVAVELAIMEQLKMVTNIAAEEGLVMKIPFFFTKIKDEAEKAKHRLEILAQIVKAAHIKEDQENYYAGNRLHLAG